MFGNWAENGFSGVLTATAPFAYEDLYVRRQRLDRCPLKEVLALLALDSSQ